ncbi:hypothetical protein JCM10908_001745 [Rhodotorula pacifica]|uniref:uncharacterized protein n=1 Tax=Rhodotorula pacifica TaxID=1495444 RepID=UPI00317083E4
MRYTSVATVLAACAGTFAAASPLMGRAVYAGDLISPSVNDTIAIDQDFQFAYLPAVPTGPHIGNPPRFDSVSVGLQGPAPIGRINGDFTSVAVLELADDLEPVDDNGPWVNDTLRIPSSAVTEAGTYYLIVTEKQESKGVEDAPTYHVQTYNISVEVVQ